MQRHKPELGVVEMIIQETKGDTCEEPWLKCLLVGPVCFGPWAWKKIYRANIQEAQKRVAALRLCLEQRYHLLGKTRRH